ncbi:SWIM zinc finger family protein [Ideonella sp. BN130291]|uniref:SWIM zinc finger family protein n=1 Tax=Ideonella sp. BN130291 TaxID=3112940 RepID=UPI002E26B4E7|nr:SWIM zinc finger family protein [Ideonella sp. BN130291]
MSWIAAWRVYDDDTLTALANAGLLRRAAKDVEAGKVALVDQDVEGGWVAADGQRVRVDAHGPQKARCDCPARGMCKHILGAALWLRDRAPSSVLAGAEEPQTAAIDPLAELLALDVAELFKAAGAAAVRRAAAAGVSDVEWRVQGGAMVLTLASLGQSCRWVGGAGFAGMVSDVPPAERKAVHLSALMALRRAHGLVDAWPAGTTPAKPAECAAEWLGPREQDFLAQVQGLLHELLSGGISHVSGLTSARLLALNMSARGEGLPRLAALLRNLGGTVDLLARRDHRAEERDALAAMSRIQALCEALAAAKGEALQALRGQVKRDFDEATALTLLPLGAYWWQTRGGARGLTVAFWDVEGARVLQATLARPDGSDVGFTRELAWSTQALWPGTGSVSTVAASSWRLEQPQLSEDGRLALGGATRATPQPLWSVTDARMAGIGCADWAELRARLRAAAGVAGEPIDAVLLRPADTRAPVLDEARQQLTWPVADAAGRWLTLVVPVAPETHQRMDNIDALAARRGDLRGILVRIERTGAAVQFVPVAVWLREADDRLQVLSLDFETPPARGTSLTARLMRLFELRRDLPPAAAPSGLAERLTAPVLEVLETQAATGRMTLTPHQEERLQDAHRRVTSVGLEILASALQAHRREPTPRAALRLYRLCELVEELDALPQEA